MKNNIFKIHTWYEATNMIIIHKADNIKYRYND